MSAAQNVKRKAVAVENGVQAPHPKRARMTIDDPIISAGDQQSASNTAQTIDTMTSNAHRPWLARTQNISEQNLFLIHCRDNLVAGSTGPKDSDAMTREFNERFKDELKKPLAKKTLLKRMAEARKQFNVDNPEYAATLQYPIPQYPVPQPHISQSISEDELDYLFVEQEEVQIELLKQTTVTNPPPAIHRKATKFSLPDVHLQRSSKHQFDLGSIYVDTITSTLDMPDSHHGAHKPCSAAQISAIDRAKYHLRRRTDHCVTFIFEDNDEHESVEHDEQFIDRDNLFEVSPWYIRRSRAVNIPDCPVDVPKRFCTRTVNAFIQIISPVRAQSLPTHYLWRSEKPVAGVYDRFGSIKLEKIYWSVDNLRELHAFARFMEVTWICDVVIDRIHWIFAEQTELREACRKIQGEDRLRSVDGEKSVVKQLPFMSDLEFTGLAAGEIDTEWLVQLADDPADVPTIMFLADVMLALGDRPDRALLDQAPKVLQNIFNQSGLYNWLTDGSRSAFCEKYHHHQPAELCYTAVSEHTTKELIDQLYTASSRNDILTLSSYSIAPMNSHSIKYGTMQNLKEANSTPEILDAEKLVLQMEVRLEQAKATLLYAREAGPEEKAEAIKTAKGVAQGLHKPADTG